HAGLEEVGLLLVEIRGSRRLHTPTRSAKDLLDGIQDRPDNRVTFGHLAIDPHPLFAGELGQPLLIHSAAPTVKSRLPQGTQEAWVDFHSRLFRQLTHLLPTARCPKAPGRHLKGVADATWIERRNIGLKKSKDHGVCAVR